MSKTPRKRATKESTLPKCSDSKPAAKITAPTRTTRKKAVKSKENEKPDINDAIRELAHLKWESAGCPEGDGTEFWYEAEREILAEKTQ